MICVAFAYIAIVEYANYKSVSIYVQPSLSTNVWLAQCIYLDIYDCVTRNCDGFEITLSRN